MRVQLTMRGTSLLVMHNVLLADPTFFDHQGNCFDHRQGVET